MAKFIPWLDKIYLSKKRLISAIVLSTLSLNLIFTFSIIYLQKRNFAGQAIFDQAQTALGLLSRDTAEGNYRRVVEQLFSNDSPIGKSIQSAIFYDWASREVLASKGSNTAILCKNNESYFEIHGVTTMICHKANSRLLIQMTFKSNPIDFLKTTPFLILILCNILFAIGLIVMTSIGMNLYLDRFVALLNKLLSKDLKDKNIPQDFESSFKVIEELMESLEQLKKRIAQSAHDLAFNQLSKKVMHNIRTPLDVIGTVLFHGRSLDKERMQMIKNSVSEIESSIEKLLLDGKKNLQPINLYSKVLEAANDMSMKYPDKISFSQFLFNHCDFSKSYKRVVDSMDFKAAILNIFSNSVEAMGKGGRIHIKTKQYGEGISITITDEGCGIDESIMPKVGTEWFSHGKKNGKGLGLYTAKKDIESWGGTLTIKNRDDGTKGVVVEITL